MLECTFGREIADDRFVGQTFTSLQKASTLKAQVNPKSHSAVKMTSFTTNLGLASSTSTEATERNNLLLGHHILQIASGTLQGHLLDGLGSLTRVLCK